MIEGTYERYQYPHNCNGLIPGSRDPVRARSATSPRSAAVLDPRVHVQPAGDQNFDVRLGVRVVNPRVYVGVGYMFLLEQLRLPEHARVRIRR